MKSAYYDATYLFKLQCVENGTLEVRAHAASVDTLFCGLHGRAEFASACHRKMREGSGTLSQLQAMLAQLQEDTAAGALHWLALTGASVALAEKAYLSAPSSTYLRAFDALHLACAVENGFTEVYSNDRHFLAAAPLFGLRGVNIIPTP